MEISLEYRKTDYINSQYIKFIDNPNQYFVKIDLDTHEKKITNLPIQFKVEFPI